MSLQEASIKGKILCSLGVNNINNYPAAAGEKILIAADNDGKDSATLNTVNKAKEELINKGAAVSIIAPQEKGDFNDMLKVQGAESIRKYIEPEMQKLTTALWILKPEDSNMLLQFEQQIKALKKFTTKEYINVALQIYEKQDIQSFLDYSNKICTAAIEKKIIADLQIMQNKFDPQHDFGNVRFNKITVQDFNGNKHYIAEDYLGAIGRDKQIMQYIAPNSAIGKEIRSELKQQKQVDQNQAIRIRR